jgi:hypothetical protein
MAQLASRERLLLGSPLRLRAAGWQRTEEEQMTRSWLLAASMCAVGISCTHNTGVDPTPLTGASTPASANMKNGASAAAATSMKTAADKPVRVIQGAFVFPDYHHGSVSIKGTEGFRFDTNGLGDGQYPGAQCIVSLDCVPGAVVSLHGEWGGLDLPGTVVWRGHTYPAGSINSGAFATIDGQFVSPPHGSEDALTITAPFTSNGFFEPDELGGARITFAGAGTATLQLRWDITLGANGTWTIISSRYEFRAGQPSAVID